VAYATDALGATGISQPLRLHITAAEGFTTVVTPQAGDTLVSIADAHSAKVEDVVALNPAYPPEGVLPEDVSIFLPQADPLITNSNFIPGFPSPVETSTPVPPEDPVQFKQQLEALGFPPQDSGGDNQLPVELPEELGTPDQQPSGNTPFLPGLVKAIPNLLNSGITSQPDLSASRSQDQGSTSKAVIVTVH